MTTERIVWLSSTSTLIGNTSLRLREKPISSMHDCRAAMLAAPVSTTASAVKLARRLRMSPLWRPQQKPRLGRKISQRHFEPARLSLPDYSWSDGSMTRKTL